MDRQRAGAHYDQRRTEAEVRGKSLKTVSKKYTFTESQHSLRLPNTVKITGETPEERSDKREPV